jgi:hypothetical protein
MPQPKKPGPRFESWMDRQIRLSRERGEFDDLPGTGKPLPDLGRPHDENWWVKRKMRSEGLSYLPPSLALRKEVHDAIEHAERSGSETELRAAVEGVNERIREAIRMGIRGPELGLTPFDVERMVREWRRRRAA